jgi:hypothetical protein
MTTTTTATTAATTALAKEALDFALLVDPSDDDDDNKGSFFPLDAANLLRMAELWLLHALDFPDESTRIFGSFHFTARCFPLFYEAYTKATNSSLQRAVRGEIREEAGTATCSIIIQYALVKGYV